MPEQTPLQKPSHLHHHEAAVVQRPFGRVHRIALGMLAVFLILCAVFSWRTRDAMANLPFLSHQGTANAQKPIVDLHPWQTAHSLEPLAVTAEEIELARDAERLADHEADQAFATAFRIATTEHPPLNQDALDLQQRIVELKQSVKDDAQAVRELTPVTKVEPAHPAESKPGKPESVSAEAVDTDSDDLALAKAQLTLDSDQLTEAQQDFARASGDQRDRIQQELAAHEAAMQQYATQTREAGQIAVISAKQNSTLARRIAVWHAQRTRYKLIEQARVLAQQDANTLIAERSASSQKAGPAEPLPTDTASRLAALQAKSARHQLLSIYTDRIQTEQQLATVYQKWSAQVLLQHRILVHLLMQSFALIVLILICVILAMGLVRHLLSRPTLDPRSVRTLRLIIQLSIQFVGVLCILIVIFGVPNQLSTILGFATAGLTVALQQFILAFIGWFILMGRNGIRVGDAVEINKVAGEVLEINLFRTTLLETGNWTDNGHPTGRTVSFVNNFAVTGQYFNFTTTGQWMWDEVSVSLPPSENSYQLLERIHQTVLKQTEQDVATAEKEWKADTHKRGLNQYSAEPTVNLRPAGSGTNIQVRYVTRASERIEMRNHIYQSVLDVLHKPAETPQP